MADLAAARAGVGPAQRVGGWLHRHQRPIRRLQWGVVGAYLVLLVVPAILTLPDRTAHIWDDLTLFAQFVFWGLWWPFVLLSMVIVGRAWCGLFCPEGALSERVSAHGLGRHVPRWLTWAGWPFVAFACTTIYGQLVSVYQYPKPVLVILGGSTLAAVVVGYLYGRNKRVWCRYLCPVNGVFALLAKLAPVHFRVDRTAWDVSPHPTGRAVHEVNCAPLVPIRTMKGAGQCHMCGRCDGFRGAVALSPRAPNAEIVSVAGAKADPWETALVFFGLMGIAVGAFHWTDSAWYVAVKQQLAEWLVDRGILWPLEATAPWWVLTNYPDRNDVLTLLDGAVLVGYILATALFMGALLSALTALAARALAVWSWARFHHLAQSFIPLAGCGVFLGLSALTVTMLRAEGLHLRWVNDLRAVLIVGASLWTVWLAWRIAGRSAAGLRRLAATASISAACLATDVGWVGLFWS
jgi:polyferredoxin